MATSINVNTVVRAALLCVGCYLPAARKVCGFVGHRAKISVCYLSLLQVLGINRTTAILIDHFERSGIMNPTEM